MKPVRLNDAPIITPAMDTRLGTNVNGPSLIRVPDWVDRPLGRYYLYFAHHQGRFIRLACADHIAGPYTIYSPGVLAIEDTPFAGHVASPDVHVDEASQRITMVYHGHECTRPHQLPFNQLAAYAESADGLSFTADPGYVGIPYLRTIFRDGWHYGFSGGGSRQLFRSRDLRQVFEGGPRLEIEGENFIAPDKYTVGTKTPTVYRTRHVCLLQRGDELDIYYSCVGDEPERIKRTTVDLRPDWTEWRGTRFQEVLRPETDYEGVNEPLIRSIGGSQHQPVHEVRDPYAYEEDGLVYLFYSVAGEQGIAVARLDSRPRAVSQQV